MVFLVVHKLYQCLFVKKTTGYSFSATKMIFIVTRDTMYNQGHLSSTRVEKIFRELNSEILKHEKIIILSWADAPSQTHHDKLTNLIGSCKAKPHHNAACMTPCRDDVKGLLRYKATIKNGCIMAVLHSDPFYWKPDKGWIVDLLKQDGKKITFELWENSACEITKVLVTFLRILLNGR